MALHLSCFLFIVDINSSAFSFKRKPEEVTVKTFIVTKDLYFKLLIQTINQIIQKKNVSLFPKNIKQHSCFQH